MTLTTLYMDSNQYSIPPAGDYNHCFCGHKNTSLSGINPISERLEMPSTIDPEDKIREYYTLNNYTKLCSIQGNP